VHRHDPVPKLPPRWLKFKHVKGEFYYFENDASDLKECLDNDDEDFNC
jgi:hypothetical protein